MGTTGPIITLVLVLASIILGWGIERHRRRLKASRFAVREAVSVECQVEACFGGDVESRRSLENWWKKLAHILRIAPDLLRADDRFDRELAPLAGFPTEDELDEVNDLIIDLGLADECQRQQIETFGECVRFLSEHGSENGSGKGGRKRETERETGERETRGNGSGMNGTVDGAGS